MNILALGTRENLENLKGQLLVDSQDITAVLKDHMVKDGLHSHGLRRHMVTGVCVLQGNDGPAEVWVTESSRPYANEASYRCVYVG